VERHHYSLLQVFTVLSLILSSATSLRGAERAVNIFYSCYQLDEPVAAYSTARVWLLRLGYYKLTRAKQAADDWVWMVDHTVQIGQEKALLIVGLRLSGLPAVGQALRHEDVEPILLEPVKESNGEIVYQQLQAAAQKTGVPREILSDHGPDVSKGIELFCQTHPTTCAVYDIKHKTAALLKRELDRQTTWQEFIGKVTHTKASLQQTAVAWLAPPNQRSKARYMSVGELIAWGEKVLEYCDSLVGEPDRAPAAGDRHRLLEKVGWIRDYRQELGHWGQLLELVTTTEKFVREQGLYRGSHERLEQELPVEVATETTARVKEELVRFVKEESEKAQEGERLLGSSEVIESVFGKFKRLEGDQAKSGITGLLLAVGAIVSETSLKIVKQALESTKTKQVLEWCQEKLGKTVQAKKREVFGNHDKAEQKLDQLKKPA
jgi:hypothetical protein